MSSPLVTNAPLDKMWGDSSAVLQKTYTILRLVRSYQVLEKEDWKELTDLWKEITSASFVSLDAAKLKISSSLRERTYSIYEPEISIAKSVEGVKACAARFLKDPDALETNPVIASHRGVKGVTLLGRYNRYSQSKNKMCTKEFVLKVTDKSEFLSNQLYSGFSTGFTTGQARYGFLVPKSVGIDFDRNIHTDSMGNDVKMESGVAQQLQQNFKTLAKLFENECQRAEPIEVCNVMLSERVDGENLYDFARRRYADLTYSQKYTLMKQAAKIVCLDLPLGQNDRGFSLFFDKIKGEIQCDFDEYIPANLGNVLVHLLLNSEVDPILYAIDNGIELDFINDSKSCEAHLKFLKKLIEESQNSSSKLADTLALKMQASFILALEPEDLTGFQHVEGLTLGNLHDKLAPFKDDIAKFALKPFKEGITKMLGYLVNTLIPCWESSMKPGLDETIGSTLQKRFDLLKQLGK